MNLEYVLKTILLKNTDNWAGKIQFEEKIKKMDKETVNKENINFQFYFTESGLPTLSLMHTKDNMIFKTDYILYLNMKLYDEILAGTTKAIRYILASARDCSSTSIIKAHDNDIKKYQKQMEKQQVAMGKGQRKAS